MIKIVDMALSRARMILALIILSVAAGLIAYVALPKEGAPNIDIPAIFVSVSYPGVSAGDAEKLLVKPLEQELKSLEGLKEIRSTAAEGYAGIALEFEFGFPKDKILIDVREKVDKAKVSFPSDTNEPSVTELNTSQFPVLVVAIRGEVPERTLLKAAESLQESIETVPMVLEAKMNGQRSEMLEVILDPLKLEAYNLTAASLINIVNNNNRIIAAGALDTGSGRFSV